MVDQVDDHRHAERIGEQDELLPLVVALLPVSVRNWMAVEPFGLGQLDVLDEAVQVTDER